MENKENKKSKEEGMKEGFITGYRIIKVTIKTINTITRKYSRLIVNT